MLAIKLARPRLKPAGCWCEPGALIWPPGPEHASRRREVGLTARRSLGSPIARPEESASRCIGRKFEDVFRFRAKHRWTRQSSTTTRAQRVTQGPPDLFASGPKGRSATRSRHPTGGDVARPAERHYQPYGPERRAWSTQSATGQDPAPARPDRPPSGIIPTEDRRAATGQTRSPIDKRNLQADAVAVVTQSTAGALPHGRRAASGHRASIAAAGRAGAVPSRSSGPAESTKKRSETRSSTDYDKGATCTRVCRRDGRQYRCAARAARPVASDGTHRS